MLYFYKILGILLREMGRLFLVGKFCICCGALGLGLEPALSLLGLRNPRVMKKA